MTIRVRFAPSPTGYLHLGNIRTALFNFLFAKKNGGQFVLRLEDTDAERSRPEFAEAQMEDLLWLGLRWDEGPEVGGPHGPYRQSERMDLYRGKIDQLINDGKAYYCYVTEEETAEMKRLAQLERRPPRFDNRGRTFTKDEIEKRKARGIKPTVRFKIDNPKASLNDLIRGEVSFNLDDMVGDFVIQRADGTPTFHLAVCVDDCLMKITHVIRGEDHLSNTPKHILLMRAMGFEPPAYGHLSLVHGPGGEPLSKRLEHVSVRQFRKDGYLPHALANYISLLGWSPGENREILSWAELQKEFDLTKVSRSSSNFDPQKLDWVNGQHFRLLSDEEFARHALAYLKSNVRAIHEPASPCLDGLARRTAGKPAGGSPLQADESFLHRILPVFKDNIERFNQLPERLEIFKDDFKYEDAAIIKTEESREIFEAAMGVLDETTVGAGSPRPEQGAATAPLQYESFIAAIKPKVKAKGKNLFHPLRMALTGKINGPELKRIFPVLGTERVKARLERALNNS